MPDQIHGFQLAQAAPSGGAGEQRSGGETAASPSEHASTAAGEHHEYKLGDIPEPEMLFGNAVVVALVLIAIAWKIRGKLAAIPDKWQNFGEFVTESMVNFTRGVIGPGGEKYVPLIGTLFFYLLLGNLWGLVPSFHSPTANLSTTLALGLIIFFYVQYVGIRSNGIGGYLKHFAGPIWWISPLLFPIEVISELIKPFTLAMRLFGNIFGEDTVVILLATLAATMIPAVHFIPLQWPIMVLGLLTAFVQALVFTLLSCIYISLQSHHDSNHEGVGNVAGHGHPGIEESGLVP